MKCMDEATEYLGYLCDTSPYSNTISVKELFGSHTLTLKIFTGCFQTD